MQFAGGEEGPDVFSVFEMRADGPPLDPRALRSHFRKQLIHHSFERGSGSSAKNQGPETPT